MTAAAYHEALKLYGNPVHECLVESISTGLINRTYKVTTRGSSRSFLLQQINHEVFADPGSIQYNYETIWSYLERTGASFKIPEPQFFPGGISLYEDSRGNLWRVNEFIPRSNTLQVASTPEQAGKVAAAFANLTKALSDFDHGLLRETIPGFHDPALRYKQFLDAEKRSIIRTELFADLIGEIKQRENYVSFYEVLTQSAGLRRRVMHHDAKISNVLFDESTGEVICPVDFDTVMPGYIFSDLGDMIRSMACCANEHDTDHQELCIREDYYEAIVKTYLQIIGDQLSDAEKKYIHFSGLLVTYMQVLRYITDHLNGDTYYQSNYPGQNLERARKQFEMLQQFEKFLKAKYAFMVR